MLPEVRDSSRGLRHGARRAGDRRRRSRASSATSRRPLFGQVCVGPGCAKNTYGTGCFLLMNTGGLAPRSRHGLLTTIGWRMDDAPVYCLEGSVFIGGAVVQWLRDGLGLIESAADVEALAASVPDSGGVVLVPAFTGLGAPHWDPYARGLIVGLTRGTTKAHIARAALEGIAFQVDGAGARDGGGRRGSNWASCASTAARPRTIS